MTFTVENSEIKLHFTDRRAITLKKKVHLYLHKIFPSLHHSQRSQIQNY